MIKSTLRKITPKIAEKMLLKTSQNRKLSRPLIQRYARDMSAGNWDVNGQPIVISNKGKLLDGQHRLKACIKNNVMFYSFVTTDIVEEAKLTIDSGKKRTFAHNLQMDNVTNSNHVAATVQTVYNILEGSTATKLTHHELQDFLDEYPGIVDSCTLNSNYRAIVPKPSILAAVHFLASQFLSNSPVAEFHHVFFTGIPHYTKGRDPAHVWRERLLRIAHKPHQSMPRKSLIDGTVHAWNLFSNGKTVANFKIPKNVKMEGLPALENLNL